MKMTMRRRLMLAMVGLVAVVLVIAGAGSLLLTRNAARNQAQQQLVTEANSLTSSKLGSQSLRELNIVKATLKLENADVIRIDRLGAIVTALPADVSQNDIDVAAVLAGQTTSGRVGNLVYAVAPVTLSQQERTRLGRADRVPFEGTFAVLLTRDLGGLGPSWGYFIIAGGAALLVAALVAWQMSRRMARPLIDAMQVTGRIASGELESRVPVRKRDYPEFASLAGSVNDMAQSLEDSRARERHLLLAVSHDLRTPLTSIRGFAEAIKDGAIDDSGRAADVIIAESRRLERLVGDLLDLTKLEAHRLSISMRPTDAAEVVTTTAEGFRPAAAKAGLDIVLHVAGQPGGSDDDPTAVPAGLAVPPPSTSLPPVAADPDRLAQLVANLIENACTFARSRVSVGLAEAGPAGGCVISVDDDGPGIAPGDLERVFERFYQADRGRNRLMGSGLGLTIVAELATAMGGHVRAVSPLGPTGGSRFEVWLGRWPAPTAVPAPPPISVTPRA
ncbi:MAG TPA: HAMP domain-containing sensor histidine kinase [Acidimicrobiales bacterium]|nr:HAMP domain-containing sensor histidine kinase [Acidimicrobiales bacterium]